MSYQINTSSPFGTISTANFGDNIDSDEIDSIEREIDVHLLINPPYSFDNNWTLTVDIEMKELNQVEHDKTIWNLRFYTFELKELKLYEYNETQFDLGKLS